MKYGAPEIMNTDQGSQCRSAAFISVLEQNAIQINMDGKGCWRDNACVSNYTSFARSETILGPGLLSDSFMPCALRGESAPGGSNRHSFLLL